MIKSPGYGVVSGSGCAVASCARETVRADGVYAHTSADLPDIRTRCSAPDERGETIYSESGLRGSDVELEVRVHYSPSELRVSQNPGSERGFGGGGK